MERKTGKVVWFNDKKGFGFLSDDSSTEEYFVHFTNIKVEGFKTLTAGQLVSYTVGRNHRGEQAEEVEVIGEPEQAPMD
jgi:CspA family cold shock protein